MTGASWMAALRFARDSASETLARVARYRFIKKIPMISGAVNLSP
jgi:hypothetical protein